MTFTADPRVDAYIDALSPRQQAVWGETINAPALSAMLKQIIADSRADGRRKLKRALTRCSRRNRYIDTCM